MQRPRNAAQRFYSAFYNWALTTTPRSPQVCCHIAPKGLRTPRRLRHEKPRITGTVTRADGEPLPDAMRTVLRPLTHPVVLLTAHHSSQPTSHLPLRLPSCRGVTISSFTTVTLDPKPIISFNLKLPSRTWDAMVASCRLCVHLLSASPEGAAIAHAFTQPYDAPDTPFRILASFGVGNTALTPLSAPSLTHQKGIIARIHARALREKCVEIGDHVVVIAEVERVETGHAPEEGNITTAEKEGPSLEGAVGLAYARRGYRRLGKEIEASELPRLDSMELPPMREGLEAETKRKAALEEEDEYDFGFAQSPPIDSPSAFSSAAKLRPRSATSDTPAGRLPRRKFSTLAQPWAAVACQRRRSFHSTATFSSSTDDEKSSVRQDAAASADQVTDASVKQSTVAEFLNVPPTGQHIPIPRIRGLLRAKREGESASRELVSRLRSGGITAEESRRLENTISTSERRVAKTLALHSARDLRRMLDTGKVDVRLAQWMEASIERGQAVVVDEARKVRALFDEGKIPEEVFQRAKGELEAEHGVMSNETMRLRALYDEDEQG